MTLRLIATLLSFSLVLPAVTPGTVSAQASGRGSYSNSRIAETALTHVGQNKGQCRVFVRQVVTQLDKTQGDAMQTGGGKDYFQTLVDAGGVRITDIHQLQKGDIIQVGQGTHTMIITGTVSISGGSGAFNVVDSNHKRDGIVRTYVREPFKLDDTTRAYRLGQALTT
jgi:hypothetical protein